MIPRVFTHTVTSPIGRFPTRPTVFTIIARIKVRADRYPGLLLNAWVLALPGFPSFRSASSLGLLRYPGLFVSAVPQRVSV